MTNKELQEKLKQFPDDLPVKQWRRPGLPIIEITDVIEIGGGVELPSGNRIPKSLLVEYD